VVTRKGKCTTGKTSRSESVLKVVSKRWRDSVGDGRLSNRRPRGRMAWEWGKPVFKFCQLKLCILVYFSYCLINFIHTTSGSTEKET